MLALELRDADRIHHPADAKNDHQSKNADRNRNPHREIEMMEREGEMQGERGNFHGERGDATLGESRLK